MADFIEIKHINSDRRKKKMKDTAETIKKGAGSFFKTVGTGIEKMVRKVQESQKPENQIKKLQNQKELLEAQADVVEAKQELQELKGQTSTGLMGGFIQNGLENINNVLGKDDKKNNGGLI